MEQEIFNLIVIKGLSIIIGYLLISSNSEYLDKQAKEWAALANGYKGLVKRGE